MKEYRIALKSHFEAIAGFKKCMDIDFVFWGIGLVFMVLGSFVGNVAGDVITGIGTWMLYFGMALAFIKKNDLGLLIITGTLTVVYLVVFIIGAANGLAVLSLIFNTIAFGTLFILAYKASDAAKKAEIKRTREAMKASKANAVCKSCGAVLAADAQFCPACGQKVPEPARCPQCGASIAEGVAFCDKCGAKLLEEKQEASVVCINCGAALTDENAFCPACGQKVPKPGCCPQCGAEIREGTAFCGRCGTRLI